MTPAQDKTLAAIEQHFDKHDYSPSLREIANATGKRSLATVHKHVKALVQQGRVWREADSKRTISLAPRTHRCVFHLDQDAICPACRELVPADTKHECNGLIQEAA